MTIGMPSLYLAIVASLVAAMECRMELATRPGPTSLRGSRGSGVATCSTLKNHGTYFSIEVRVGTPAQKFDVVADTGSNTLIIPSCLCQRAGKCEKADRCFVGTNRSSTFTIPQGRQGPRAISLHFGSGTIAGVIVKDEAQIGSLRTYMKDGLVLMTDQALNFAGHFEGILGLGLPMEKRPEQGTVSAAGHRQGGYEDIIRRIMKKIAQGSPATGSRGHGSYAQVDLDMPSELRHQDEQGQPVALMDQPTGFMEQSHVGRFSMCFNYGDNGVFRLGTPVKANAHGSIGTYHWGLDFRGISVGSQRIDICSPGKMKPGQVTPCGAIPDSGTTMIMGPEEQVLGLFESLCDQWDRCRRNHTALVGAAAAASRAAERAYGIDPFDISVSNLSKAEVFQWLLLDCEKWLDHAKGLDELPKLEFHVVGSNGTKQSLALPPAAYVIESELKHANLTSKLTLGDKLKGHSKVCSPAFGGMGYETTGNGPVWILGTPFFYEFTVGYDMFSKPPTISFTSTAAEPCGRCGSKTGLVATAAAHRGSRPRWQPGPARQPTGIDFSQPL